MALAILAVLISLVAGAILRVRGEARKLICMNNARTTAFAFRMFADPYAHSLRGDSDTLYGPRFSGWDFLESVYRAAEFWPTASELEEGRFRYQRGRDPVLCAAVPSGLACVSPGFSLESGRAVAPAELVSYALNRRLVYAPFEKNGYQAARFVTLGERVLDHPNVPLLFDVDAAAAVTRWGARGPLLSAPAGSVPSIYDGTPSHPEPYWFPAKRHAGRMVIAFVGGHVVAASDPFADPAWDWDYHPPLTP